NSAGLRINFIRPYKRFLEREWDFCFSSINNYQVDLMTSAITQIKPATTLYVERCAVTTPVPDIVIMFGWTNGQLKHLSKIASFWRAKGNYHILYYTAPDFPYIYFPYKAEKLC